MEKLIQLDLDGYVCRTIPVGVLIQAIKMVCNGRKFIDKELAPLMLNLVKIKELYKRLTEREVEVMSLLIKGFSVKRIAKELFVTERTVRFHLKNICCKLGLRSKKELRSILDDLRLAS